jgi:TatD DNase family protein
VDRITDTHCHLNLNSFQEDLPSVLDRAIEKGMDHILVPGIDLETSRLAVELASQYPIIYAAIGVHPNDANQWHADTKRQLAELATATKVVAIGEIGLDYYRDHAPRSVQWQAFTSQLELAAECHLPVVIHNRDAQHDVWQILSDWRDQLELNKSPIANRPGVLHSFAGSAEEGLLAIEKGFFLGIGGPVTFTNAVDRQNVVRQLPLDHLLTETDAPYLTPHPYRGRRNEPSYTALIIEKIASLHQMEYGATARLTAGNAARLFAWEL